MSDPTIPPDYHDKMVKALEHMGDVATRIDEGKISYKDGLRELISAGMQEGDAEEWLENVTDPIHRKQS